MIITITNLSENAFNANGVYLDSEETMVLHEGNFNEFRLGLSGKITFLSTKQNWFYPFGTGDNGAVPELASNQHLYVQVWLGDNTTLNSTIKGQAPLATN